VSELFGSGYAAAYDAVYLAKDYTSECDLIEELFRSYGKKPIASVLDLGCGTGNHALLLASRGYEVLAVDSSPHMLAEAEKKLRASSLGDKCKFHEGDIRQLDLDRRFDAVVVMFAVLGYQLENADVLSTLNTARKHLKNAGLLIFDVWYGPAVLHERPVERIKTIKTEKGELLRASSGKLDVNQNVCTVDIRIWNLEGDRLVGHTEESHTNRYFFPLELELFLNSTGFDPIRLGAFPKFDRDPDESTWNVLQVAKANTKTQPT
jgi:SAM-dependent methyltransferase